MFSEESIYYSHNNTKPCLPEGYELQRTPRLQVKKIENKEDYIDLFLEADPSKDMIHKYLNDSDVYALKKEDEIICIAAICTISRKTLELKNIVTKEEYRGKGYAKTLLKSLCGNYKQKYDKMLVGTTENNIPFYVKQGFDKYEKTIKNYFIDNYKEEIKDGDLICTDLIYYSKDLKKK
ncbi:MAG: GNAT family N-acetyltransferase [Clostridia bacterium]